jgi:hypothetical protein
MMLAQIQPDMNWPETIKTLVGIVGVLSIVWLILSVAVTSKKLFGRKPPIFEELDKLRKEFAAGDLALTGQINQLQSQMREGFKQFVPWGDHSRAAAECKERADTAARKLEGERIVRAEDLKDHSLRFERQMSTMHRKVNWTAGAIHRIGGKLNIILPPNPDEEA